MQVVRTEYSQVGEIHDSIVVVITAPGICRWLTICRPKYSKIGQIDYKISIQIGAVEVYWMDYRILQYDRYPDWIEHNTLQPQLDASAGTQLKRRYSAAG